jgi:hypothetical protein
MVTPAVSKEARRAILVPGLNRDLGIEHRVRLSSDELTAYVGRGNPWWVSDLYVAQRASRVEPFGGLVPLTQLNGPGGEVAASVTGDGLTLFMDRSGETETRIYAATRQTVAEPFGAPSNVALLQGAAVSEWDPYVLPDGSALYFVAFVAGEGGIYRATLQGTSAELPTAVPFGSSAGFRRIARRPHSLLPALLRARFVGRVVLVRRRGGARLIGWRHQRVSSVCHETPRDCL